MIDDEILLGCKGPDDENNFDLRPVIKLGFESNRLNLNSHKEKPTTSCKNTFFMAKRTSKSSEAKTRTINKVISK